MSLISQLFDAAHDGDSDRIRALMKAGADINECYCGHTALHVVCTYLYFDVAVLLLGMGAAVNTKDRHDWETPLHLASSRRAAVDFVRLLLDHGADIEEINGSGMTSLHLACRNEDIAILRLLLDRNANVNAKDEKGNTPLYSHVRRDILKK